VNPIELALHIQGTQDFINSDPSVITLVPTTVTWHGGSKRESDLPARDPQTFKVIWPGGDQIVTTSQGSTYKLDFILVGMPDAQVAVGDHWSEGKRRYRIFEIEPANGYEVKAKGTMIGAVADAVS
jgi:hypothetical protein